MYKTEREPETMATLTLTLIQMYVASYKPLPVFSISEYIYSYYYQIFKTVQVSTFGSFNTTEVADFPMQIILS